MSKKNSPEPPVKKNAFVHKLYSMLNDPKLSHLIWWTRNEESNTFALYPGKEFANALTGYFKHGNVASFVRQLHMYGFHKVSDPQAGDSSIPSANNINSKENPPMWEFKHSSGKFKKNDEGSLIYIKRRSSSNSSRNNPGYNSETESNVLIPTSTPSPGSFDHFAPGSYHFSQPPHAQPTLPHAGQIYYQVLPSGTSVAGPTSAPISSLYLPQPYHHVQYPPGTVPYPYTSSQLPVDHHQHHHPQQLQHPHPPPPHHHHPPPPPPFSHPHLASTFPYPPEKQQLQQNQLDQAQESNKPATETSPKQTSGQSSAHPQHYTPNLQFRKIWEPSNQQTRPRNPSLRFDPLAPAPAAHLAPAPTSNPVARPEFSPTPENHSPDIVHPEPTPTSIPPPPPQLGGSPYLSTRSDSASSFTSPRLSIKLPPPSSIHRASSNLASFPSSPGLKGPGDELLLYHSPSISLVTEERVMSTKLPRSLPGKFENYAGNNEVINKGNTSLPSSPHGEKPSLTPISSSLQERLRPSLIELHFGSSATPSQPNSAPSSLPGSASAPSSAHPPALPAKQLSFSTTKAQQESQSGKIQQNSIGSQSSNNSVFSNKSSLSSLSSAPRTSSFGSISHYSSWDLKKSSISIGPHDPIPLSLPTIASVASIVEETDKQVVATPSPIKPESNSSEIFSIQNLRSSLSASISKVTVRPHLFRSLTPPNLHSKKSNISPVPRASSSLQYSSSGNVADPSLNLAYNKLRALTTSPLAKTVVKEECDSTTSSEKSDAPVNGADAIKKETNKVSVNSLLGEDNTSKCFNINSIINESEHESDGDRRKETETKETKETKETAELTTMITDQQIKRQKLE